MSAFTTKTQFNFEPAVNALALSSTGVKHTTNSAWSPTLGDLSFIPYRRAFVRYSLNCSALATAGAVTIECLAGGAVKGSAVVTLTQGQYQSGKIDVDLGLVAGESPITMKITVDTASNAGVTADFIAAIDIEVPLIVSTC